MKQKYFTIVGNNLKVLHLESIRIMFYQIAGGFYVIFAIIAMIVIAGSLFSKQSLIAGLAIKSFSDFLFSFTILFIGIILPTVSLVFAHRFPPAPEVVFHADNQTTTWKSGNNRLELPFPTIHFATTRLLSKSGISTVMVSVFAIADRPFFADETASPDPDMRYRKDLFIYKAGTQAEADESIEIVKSFMAGTYDESPKKFDNL